MPRNDGDPRSNRHGHSDRETIEMALGHSTSRAHLNLHYTDVRNACRLANDRFVRLGRISQCLTTHYPEWAHIAAHFSNVWDAPVARGTDPRGITPTVLDLVKNEIIEMMVCMHHLPATMLDRIAPVASSLS